LRDCKEKNGKETHFWETGRTTDTLEIVVPSEMAKELRKLVKACLREPNEGLRMTLGAGMAALEAQRRLQEEDASSEEVKLARRARVVLKPWLRPLPR